MLVILLFAICVTLVIFGLQIQLLNVCLVATKIPISIHVHIKD